MSARDISELLARMDSAEESIQDLQDENRTQEKEIDWLKKELEVVRNQKNKRPL